MENKVNYNTGKWFDAKKTAELFLNMQNAAVDYCKKSEATGVAYQSFVASESFMGKAADETKNFIGNGMGSMNIKVADEHKKCIQEQIDILDGFRTMVDSSPYAYIDYDVLEAIDTDFVGYHGKFGKIAGSVDLIIGELNKEFGEKYGEFPEPNKGGVNNSFADFCSVGGNGGYVKECQNKFVAFDSELTDHVRAHDTEAFNGEFNQKIANATNSLNNADAMPKPLKFTNMKFIKNIDADLGNDVNAKYQVNNAPLSKSPFDRVGSYGANHESTGVSRWGFFGIHLDGNGRVYDRIEGERDWDRTFYEQKGRKNGDSKWTDMDQPDKRDYAIFRALDSIKSSDSAATNVIFQQTSKFSEDWFQDRFDMPRMYDGDLNYQVMQGLYREKTMDVIDPYKIGGVGSIVQEKCNYYIKHPEEFQKLHPNIRLMNQDGSINLAAKEQIRKDLVSNINKGWNINDLLVDNHMRKPDTNEPLRIFSDLTSEKDGMAANLNELEYFTDRNNLSMNATKINKGSQYPPKELLLSELKSGKSIISEVENCVFSQRYIDSKGYVAYEPVGKIDGKETVNITGFDEYGYYVAYKGKEWYILSAGQPVNMKMGDCYSISIWEKENGAGKLIQGENPLYGFWERTYKDANGNIHYTQCEKLAEMSALIPECKDWPTNSVLAGSSINSYLADAAEGMAARGSMDTNRLDMLLSKYSEKPDEFKKKYNIPLYDTNGKFNKEGIMLDFYAKYGNSMIIDYDNADDMKCLTDYYFNYYMDHQEEYVKTYNKEANRTNIYQDSVAAAEAVKQENKAKGINIATYKLVGTDRKYYVETSERENAKFEQYCKDHGEQVTITKLNGKSTAERMKTVNLSDNNAKREAMVFNGIPTNSEIKQNLSAGYKVVFKCADPCNLEAGDGNPALIGVGELRSNEITITDVRKIKGSDGVEREMYTVSCNGKQYYYDPKKHTEDCSDYYAIKVN